MPKIINKKYNEFIKEGLIQTLEKEDVNYFLKKINHKFIKEARTLFILMYYTGARPAEILNLTAGDIRKEGQSYLVIQTRALKNGLPRQIRLRFRAVHIKEVYDFSIGRPENMYLFPHFRSKTTRTNSYVTKKGDRKIKNYVYVSNGLWYHFNKWFGGEINPYFMRHNRFSKLMDAGASMEEVMLLKGAKSMESVRPYVHMSRKKSEEIAKKIK